MFFLYVCVCGLMNRIDLCIKLVVVIMCTMNDSLAKQNNKFLLIKKNETVIIFKLNKLIIYLIKKKQPTGKGIGDNKIGLRVGDGIGIKTNI